MEMEPLDLATANARLLETLVKMKEEREEVFEKSSVLGDACGRMMSEKVYMVQNLAKAVDAIGKLERENHDLRKQITELRSLSRAVEGPSP